MRAIDIRFPLGGENRRGAYTQRDEPFTVVFARNIRNAGPFERRVRGGSRPMLAKYVSDDFGTTITGMEKVSYLDNSGNLQHDVVVICDGNLSVIQGSSVTTTIGYLSLSTDTITIGSDNIIMTSTVASVNPIGNTDGYQMVEFEGDIYIAGNTCQRYDPSSGLINTVANAPTGQPSIATYQGRLVLFGSDHIVYMSRMGDFEDWNFGDDYRFVNRAVALFAGNDGIIGGTVHCGLNYNDQAFVMGTTDDLWVVYGNPRDPANGGLKNVSHHLGIIAPGAAAITPNGLVIMIARDGIYTWQIGSEAEPEPFSPVVIPEDFRDIDVTANDIMVKYDHKNRGVFIFKTPSGAGEHWWLDLEHKAMWPLVFPNNNHQPLASCRLPQSGDSDVLIGCKDGYVREFSNSATNDDGTAVPSELMIGPIHLSRDIEKAGMIQRLIANFADNSGSVTWRIVVGDSAEEAADAAETAYAASWASGVAATGTWTQGHNAPVYPRARGGYAMICLSSTARWSWEAMRATILELGRIR